MSLLRVLGRAHVSSRGAPACAPSLGVNREPRGRTHRSAPTAMNSANRQQLKELFHAAVELAPHDREAFLKANCAADDELHCEVSALLSAHESAGDFIQQPALVDVGLVAKRWTSEQ